MAGANANGARQILPWTSPLGMSIRALSHTPLTSSKAQFVAESDFLKSRDTVLPPKTTIKK